LKNNNLTRAENRAEIIFISWIEIAQTRLPFAEKDMTDIVFLQKHFLFIVKIIGFKKPSNVTDLTVKKQSFHAMTGKNLAAGNAGNQIAVEQLG